MIPRQLSPQLVDEPRVVRVEGRQRQPEDQVGDVVGPPLREREQEQRERPPGVLVDPAEQAEVEQGEPPVLRQEHVAPVGIGVVDALHRHLADVGAEERPGEEACAFGLQPVVRLDLAPVDPLQHEDPFADMRADHLRDHELLVVGDQPRDELRVARLLGEVELSPQVHLELVGQRLGLQQPRPLRATLEHPRGRPEEVEVESDLLRDARAADLHDHLPPGREQSRVDLRDRRGGERLRVEACEDPVPEVLPDRPLDLRERNRRHLVDEPSELLDVHVREEVGTRREELSQLDVGRAELLQRRPELARALLGRGAVTDDADLSQDAHQASAPGHPRDVERAPRAPDPGAHGRFLSASPALETS